MDKDIKIKFNKLEDTNLFEHGYIDLSKASIKNNDDLVNICNTFRNPCYETFRVFYIKEKMIVGHEAITSRIPDAVMIYSEKNPIKWFEKMKNRMLRLNADGYYLAHNHATESAVPSKEDMEMTKKIATNIEGFLGHIVLGNKDRYSIIEKDLNGRILLPQEKCFENKVFNEIREKTKDKSIYDIKIDSRESLVYVLKQIQNDKEYSTTILTDAKANIRMILDIPNKMFNQEPKNLNGFFKNLARNTGSIRVFIGTQDVMAYSELLKHQKYGTIKDMVYFNYAKDFYKTENIKSSPDLFDKEKRRKSLRTR